MYGLRELPENKANCYKSELHVIWAGVCLFVFVVGYCGLIDIIMLVLSSLGRKQFGVTGMIEIGPCPHWTSFTPETSKLLVFVAGNKIIIKQFPNSKFRYYLVRLCNPHK